MRMWRGHWRAISPRANAWVIAGSCTR
jgi:hypothetical protein